MLVSDLQCISVPTLFKPDLSFTVCSLYRRDVPSYFPASLDLPSPPCGDLHMLACESHALECGSQTPMHASHAPASAVLQLCRYLPPAAIVVLRLLLFFFHFPCNYLVFLLGLMGLTLLVQYWLDPVVGIFLWCFQCTLLVPPLRGFVLIMLSGVLCATMALTSVRACKSKTTLSDGLS
ncbi:hypothetical protein SLA2020_261800 [Shorea laevis]